MSILRRLLHGTQLSGPLKRLRGRIPFFHAETSDKLSSELRFKSWVVSQQIAWFRGELPMLYGEPAPAENVRVNVGTEKDNAILRGPRFIKRGNTSKTCCSMRMRLQG
jgi:hypothetical protein